MKLLRIFLLTLNVFFNYQDQTMNFIKIKALFENLMHLVLKNFSIILAFSSLNTTTRLLLCSRHMSSAGLIGNRVFFFYCVSQGRDFDKIGPIATLAKIQTYLRNFQMGAGGRNSTSTLSSISLVTSTPSIFTDESQPTIRNVTGY